MGWGRVFTVLDSPVVREEAYEVVCGVAGCVLKKKTEDDG